MEEHTGKFQLITMRALRLEPEHIASLASLVLAQGGVLAWWGSTGASEGLAGSGKPAAGSHGDMEFQGGFSYLLPGIKQQRAVWAWRKT